MSGAVRQATVAVVSLHACGPACAQCCADLDCRTFILSRLSFGIVLYLSNFEKLSALHSMGSRRLHGALLAHCSNASSLSSRSSSVPLGSLRRCAFIWHLAFTSNAEGAHNQVLQHGLQALPGRDSGALGACLLTELEIFISAIRLLVRL